MRETRAARASASVLPLRAASARIVSSRRSEWTTLGITALMRMPSLARSPAIALMRLRIAALLSPTDTAAGCGWRAAPPSTLTMRPHLRGRISGTASRIERAVPSSLSSKSRAHLVSSSEKKSPRPDHCAAIDENVEPAELRHRALEHRAQRDLVVEVRPGTPTTRPFATRAISVEAAALRSEIRQPRTTSAPSAASSAARASPMPRLAPVTMATRPGETEIHPRQPVYSRICMPAPARSIR